MPSLHSRRELTFSKKTDTKEPKNWQKESPAQFNNLEILCKACTLVSSKLFEKKVKNEWKSSTDEDISSAEERRIENFIQKKERFRLRIKRELRNQRLARRQLAEQSKICLEIESSSTDSDDEMEMIQKIRKIREKKIRKLERRLVPSSTDEDADDGIGCDVCL